jgi:metal-responsive CopG/Arc/MetJ family transcriptional regulator
MSGKTEIKVYLPSRLVGQLDSRKQAGVRSKFIKEAIEEKLSRRASASPFDFSFIQLMCTCRDLLDAEGLTTYVKILQAIIDERL